MSLILKVCAVVLALSALMAVVFLLFGDWWEAVFSSDACVEWFDSSRDWAWLAAIGLLMGDLVLPIPATAVMAALGVVYGVLLGTVIGVVGSSLSGILAYGVGRWAGEPAIRRISSAEEREQFRHFFDRWGGAAVIVSRCMPILPEVTAILAGLARMTFIRFVAALLLGTIPTVVLFVALGVASAEAPLWGILAAALIPLAVWVVVLARRKRK